MAEDVGIEPTHASQHGLALAKRRITSLPAFRGLTEETRTPKLWSHNPAF